MSIYVHSYIIIDLLKLLVLSGVFLNISEGKQPIDRWRWSGI